MKVAIAITTKDRATELSLLLQAFRTQTEKDFEVWIMEDRSNVPLPNHHFFNCIVNRMRDEGNPVIYHQNNLNLGLPRVRQKLMDKIIKESNCKYVLTIDDDVIPERDYIEKLLDGINKGFDFVSGVIPPMIQPAWKRDTKFVKPMIDDYKFKDGKLIHGDECGFGYTSSDIIPSHHFRSGGLGRKELFAKTKYPDFLGGCSFREEDFFSIEAILNGFKFAVNTGAVIWHQMTPSGGNRDPNYEANIRANIDLFENWLKKKIEKHGNFLEKYNKEVLK
jgi:GT2 family glycosyltransferase